ncbi:sulfur carrier protein ThiS [Nitratireductor sp. XY-223]|uniref:sulfur carrier protein ThiS n=1 Tax=Nitratireductor sp. XY-223 TaxID=2561926 RepID=UPI0010AA99F7|nr:sulfur carrier protein ThiS [Nitratireductor sp. XY-223]
MAELTLVVNGRRAAVSSRSLGALLSELSYEGEWLATAVNGVVVHRDDRATHVLCEGDRIEILSPMQGG